MVSHLNLKMSRYNAYQQDEQTRMNENLPQVATVLVIYFSLYLHSISQYEKIFHMTYYDLIFTRMASAWACA